MAIQANRWTATAVMCYERGCICKGCEMNGLFSCKCKMKKSVLELVKKYGIPDKKSLQFRKNIYDF